MEKSLLLKITDLSLRYGSAYICRGIDITLKKNDIFGIAGESGSGKSTLLKAIMDFDHYGITATKGSIEYNGENILSWPDFDRKRLRGTTIGMISQNPFTNFNPIRTYSKQFRETLKSHNQWQDQKSVTETLNIFSELGLPDGNRILNSCPFEMSGGMNQRISIALSILLKPTILLADEPTSALDVSSESQLVKQFQQLNKKHGVSMLFVSHNLSVIARLCNKIAIMYGGKILEYGDTRKVLLEPAHPYTKSLLRAIPKINKDRPEGLEGVPPLQVNDSDKCPFFSRCPIASCLCQERDNKMNKISDDHYSRCLKKEQP